MTLFKFILSLAFLSFFLFNLYDFFKSNSFSSLVKRGTLFFLTLLYAFFVLFLFLEQGGLKFRFYSELYLIVGLILLIIFIVEESFFYNKTLIIFFAPFLIYVLILGFHFLDQEKSSLSFNLIQQGRFDQLGEIFLLLGTILMFYTLVLSVLYRYLFLEFKLKKPSFLSKRIPSLTRLNFLISLNLNLGIVFFCLKTISVIQLWRAKSSPALSYNDIIYYFGIIFILSFFSMVSFFRFKNWLHSRLNLTWLYLGNTLLILYLIFLY